MSTAPKVEAPLSLADVFVGDVQWHGVYDPATERQYTAKTPATTADFDAHRKGKGRKVLGIHMLRQDGTVRFAAIDVDRHPDKEGKKPEPVNHKALV